MDPQNPVEELVLDPELSADIHDEFSAAPRSAFPMSANFLTPSLRVGMQGAAGTSMPGSIPILLNVPAKLAPKDQHQQLQQQQQQQQQHSPSSSSNSVLLQVDVPQTATVGELKQRIRSVYPDFDIDAILAFNNKNWEDESVKLIDTGILGAYDHAGSLLWAIDESALPVPAKVAALNGACAVVEKIASGVNDVDSLVQAAKENAASWSYRSNHQPSKVKINASSPNINNQFPVAVTPPVLINELSSKLPQLFPQSSAMRLNELWGKPASGWAELSSTGWADDSTNNKPNNGKNDNHHESHFNPGLDNNHDGNSNEIKYKTIHDSIDYVGRNKIKQEISTSLPPPAPVIPNNWLDDIMSNWEGEINANFQRTYKNDNQDNIYGDDENDENEEEYDDDDDDDDGNDNDKQSINIDTDHGFGSYSTHQPESGISFNKDGQIKKKRGRKRKNPELNEEQRRELRMQQNRESAKKSREKKKTLTQEYSGKIDTLTDENSFLKDQVAALRNRIQFLQSLLTVNVQVSQPNAQYGGIPGIPMQHPQQHPAQPPTHYHQQQSHDTSLHLHQMHTQAPMTMIQPHILPQMHQPNHFYSSQKSHMPHGR